MKRLGLLWLLSLSISCLAPCGPVVAQVEKAWVARYDGPGRRTDFVRTLAVDGAGNIYVTGYSHPSSGNNDVYATVKYDPDGNELWVAQYDEPGGGDDQPWALAVDGDGNVYVTGTATIKYDSEGNELWVARYEGPESSDNHASALDLDEIGNVYVTGHSCYGGACDYGTVKYDSDGNELWVARYEALGDGAVALAIDRTGSVYVTGSSEGYRGDSSYDYATIKYVQAPIAGFLRGDCNDDGTVDISDAIATLGVLFLGNGIIPAPGMTDCGDDPTDDALGCEQASGCP